MKKQLSILIVLCFFSCESGKNTLPVPVNLIPEKKFTLVLEDLMILEHQVQTDYPQIDHFQKVMKKTSKKLFEKHKVEKHAFETSFEYYASDQVRMKAIYTAILDDMNRKLNKLQVKKS